MILLNYINVFHLMMDNMIIYCSSSSIHSMLSRIVINYNFSVYTLRLYFWYIWQSFVAMWIYFRSQLYAMSSSLANYLWRLIHGFHVIWFVYVEMRTTTKSTLVMRLVNRGGNEHLVHFSVKSTKKTVSINRLSWFLVDSRLVSIQKL